MTETELVERLEKLERAHRRFKGFAVAALVLATALATIYATQPVPHKIAAHRFEVVDDSGQVRVEIGVSSGIAFVATHAADGAAGAFMGTGTSGNPYVTISDPNTKGAIHMNVDLSGTPSIGTTDQQGFEMDLGSTSTVRVKTGATEHSSAASIVMFGNDGKRHVIWRGP
jgi:hypothetical protein